MDIEAERAYPTPFQNSSLLPMLLLSLATQQNSPNFSGLFNDTYDYIVVGAGSAGSVVASRLSEMPCVNVLLLEVGGPPPLLTDVPSVSRSFIGSDIDWKYITTPQQFTGNGLVNRQVPWPSGKALGGTSVINAMIDVRGNMRNYDDWAAQGATGWSYNDVLPFFKMLENDTDPEFADDTYYHGTDGPMTISQPQYNPILKSSLIDAAYELGYNFTDPNAATQTGFYDLQATLRDGQRCSTAKAYLVPAQDRPNLDILPYSMVTQVLIENGTAVGVSFDYNGTSYNVTATSEVILSAGTVNTAQLLMLSGIGPAEQLQQLNIPVVADLPVGQNLQDHCGTLQPFQLNNATLPFFDQLASPDEIETYINNRTGPLSSTEAVVLVAFLNDLRVASIADYPDYELYFQEGVFAVLQSQFGYTPEVFNQVYGPYEDDPFYLCIPQILHPGSRGNVTLQSNDPYDSPLINPNYLADPQDLEDLVSGMKTCMNIGQSRAMQSIGSMPFDTVYPGCEDYKSDEDLYFQCQARSMVFTLNHEVGTAKMGNPLDPTTVVDPLLRVKGISGLRVIDASIMPIIPSGNTNIPTIMVAEKGSFMIKQGIQCN